MRGPNSTKRQALSLICYFERLFVSKSSPLSLSLAHRHFQPYHTFTRKCPNKIRLFSTNAIYCQIIKRHDNVMDRIGKGGVYDDQASFNEGHNFKGVLA
jgi:hypothetical protein